MPAINEIFVEGERVELEERDADFIPTKVDLPVTVAELVPRVSIPVNTSSPAGLIAANAQDPWAASGKYGLGWVYFGVILLVLTTLIRLYNLFTDRVRAALHQEHLQKGSKTSSPATDYELSDIYTARSTTKFFPRTEQVSETPPSEATISSVRPLNMLIAMFRFVFYRPMPVIVYRKRWRPIVFPSLSVICIATAGLVFSVLYTFIPQPLFFQSMAFGSPPVAIRAGMLAVAMMPWIIATSMKANIVSIMTGIGHERLNTLHRWGAYICLILSLIHTIPFYIQKLQDPAGYAIWRTYFNTNGIYIFGTGFAALAPLIFLCIHSLAALRHWAYELFVTTHVPVAIIYLGMLFWHCKNYLTSWNYLFATLAIWVISYAMRILYLNWTVPWRLSWLIGEESAVTLMDENAIKVTIPSQMRWRPGQYVYLRMPGISVFENHPFTIASLCSEDFPSEYGEGYRDMVLVFKPFKGFTKKVLESALEHGPWHTYRAFIDGPYGGMRRRLEAFDHVVLIAGGSGITAIASQLLDLIKRMRDGKAVTKNVQVIWAIKRPETMEWFKEELRICREYAPPDTVQCQFYITAAKRLHRTGELVSAQTPTRPVSHFFKDKVNDVFQDIAEKRTSNISAKRNSALIRDEAAGDPEREKELRKENEDSITALPKAHLVPTRSGSRGHLVPPPQQHPDLPQHHTPPELIHPQPTRSFTEKRRERNLSLDIQAASRSNPAIDQTYARLTQPASPDSQQASTGAAPAAPSAHGGFDFGFPSTPTEFQKNLMRFAFLPAAVKKKDGWSTEYGRPDLPYTLRQASAEFGRRTCVLVCGPPGMRMDVSRTVAELQVEVLKGGGKEEIFLHAENYAI
ncbi:hypothetical protein EV356DRAFT_518227 [Viridothelium virens]|uniref:ferric-chelate reductase (NADPH) n=1 Tax=Viridothelium virens TaxID=1048519 RepID=A0A6A6H190_VIRVR|nr:hypothetical protein EV356DRAFT_518227 [Viridothelium virens]